MALEYPRYAANIALPGHLSALAPHRGVVVDARHIPDGTVRRALVDRVERLIVRIERDCVEPHADVRAGLQLAIDRTKRGDYPAAAHALLLAEDGKPPHGVRPLQDRPFSELVVLFERLRADVMEQSAH